MFNNFKESRENPPAKPAHYVSGFENGYISSRCFLFSPLLPLFPVPSASNVSRDV